MDQMLCSEELKAAALKRDKFIGFLNAFRQQIQKGQYNQVADTLKSLHREYAAPDHNLPDFELAETLRKLDNNFPGTPEQRVSVFLSEASSESRLPSWAVCYLKESASKPKAEDLQRRVFLSSLWSKNDSKELCFLLAVACCQEGCYEVENRKFDIAEELFEKATGLFRTLETTLPETYVSIPIYRIESIFSQPPRDIVQRYETWAIRNYIELLRERRNIEKAWNFIRSHSGLQRSDDLMNLFRELNIEKRLRDDLLPRKPAQGSGIIQWLKSRWNLKSSSN